VADLRLIHNIDGLDAAALRDAYAQRPMQIVMAQFARRRDQLLGQLRNAKDWGDYQAIQARLLEVEEALKLPERLIAEATRHAEEEAAGKHPRRPRR
jgi:hypothetical protein